jgi:uncharacterized protein YkwD
VLIDATGRLVHYELTVEELSLGASITADIALPARVQLVARGPGGPRPIAERIIPKGKYTQVSSPGGDRFAVLSPTETDAFNHLSQIRSAWGSPPVRKNRLLAQVATTHARAICETGRIAHELRAGDDPEKRLKQAGIQARGVGEALAHGESVFAAMAALQRSPSHLMTLIDRRFTDGAVGVSTDRDSKPCVVVLLAIWPRVIGNAAP